MSKRRLIVESEDESCESSTCEVSFDIIEEDVMILLSIMCWCIVKGQW